MEYSRGHLEGVETPIECALREAKEESGYDVELTGIQAVYHRPSADEYIIDYCFLARPKSLVTSPLADDVLEAKWFTREETEKLPRESLRSARSAKRLEDWLAGVRHPISVVAQPPLS
ncbi:MAG: NUDIX domain-containing protein [bacterium]|nr:NUDIX domain-containing protein [bacterium]